MVSHIFRPSGTFLRVFAVLALAFFGICFGGTYAAEAAPPPAPALVAPGCSDTVWDALQAKAQAQVAYDAAVTRQLINKPHSVLTLTCFDQQAANSAKNGGAVFSGDFTDDLKKVMPVASSATPDCKAIDDLWDQITDDGVSTGVPYASFNDLLTGNLPDNGGNDFNSGWNAASDAGVFTNLGDKFTALNPPAAIDFSATRSSCQVLVQAQIIPGPCP